MKKVIILLAVLCCALAVFAESSLTEKEILEKFSYYLGAAAYADNNSQIYGLDVDSFVKGAKDLANNQFSMTNEELQSVYNGYVDLILEKMKAENLEYAETFLAKNKAEKGVVTTKTGLQYKINTRGTGSRAKEGDTVKVYYKLTLPDGTVADERNEETGAVEFSLTKGQLIDGFLEVCTAVPVGSKVTAWIHPDLGYGENGIGSDIQPNMLLQFDVEILSIV